MEINIFEMLVGYLKITGQNIRILHRHLIGQNWMNDHKQFAEYYEMIDDIEDAIVEMGLILGYRDIPVTLAAEKFTLLEANNYPAEIAYGFIKSYFDNIISMIDMIKKDLELPGDVVSKLEEYQYDLRLEADYKIARLLTPIPDVN